MNTKMYVGNLPSDVTEPSLRELFAAQGPVDDVAVIMDHDTGAPRGFGFVTMTEKDDMTKAIEALHGTDFHGSVLVVNEARPRTDRPGSRRS